MSITSKINMSSVYFFWWFKILGKGISFQLFKSNASSTIIPITTDALTTAIPITTDASTTTIPITTDSSTTAISIKTDASTTDTPITTDASSSTFLITKDVSSTAIAITTDASSTTIPQDCSFPPCHTFKNGNLVLFPGKENVTGNEKPKNSCYPYNGTIFVPRTEEDNKIWLEFTKMLYNEDNSFKEAWYPMAYDYFINTGTFYWVYDTSIDEVKDYDYRLKIDDPDDGQPDFDNVTFRDYDSGIRSFIFFSHDMGNVFGQLQFRDGEKGAGFAVCSARKLF
ncbi:hypothetical protein Anas_04499 [Armadillidium nasatum]|uniref:Uncharacterized protein n=1 Tax=Armadillidium nasatum TaxID=96803 RepID=A0A5N5SL77_9CRUS|nr:hypothetical protein Anas_04499 [Armadillidium nasatum]